MNVVMMMGLPGSGKTTLCRKLFGDYYSVSRDDTRSMIYSGKYAYKPEDEYLVRDMVHNNLRTLMAENLDIVIDETMVNPLSRQQYLSIIRENEKYHAIALHIDIPKDICIERRILDDKGAKNTDWKKIIDDMAEKFIAPKKEDGYDYVFSIKPGDMCLVI